MMCRARLMRRLPARGKRCRFWSSDEASRGAVPFRDAKWARLANRLISLMSPSSRAAPDGPIPCSCAQIADLAGDENTGRVIRIRRAALKQGTTAESDGEIATNLVYNVPLSQTAGGPYDMNSAAVSTWGQSDLPTDSTAVFVPEEAPARGSATAGVATIPVVSRSCAPRAAQLRYRGSTHASARSANSSASTRCRNVGLRVGLLVKPPP